MPRRSRPTAESYENRLEDHIISFARADDVIGQHFQVLSVGSGTVHQHEHVDGRQHRKLRDYPQGFAVIQTTISGSGYLIDHLGDHHTIDQHRGLCLTFPGAFAYGPSESWQRVWMTLSGTTALELCHALHTQTGHVLKANIAEVRDLLLNFYHAACQHISHSSAASQAFHILNTISRHEAPGDRTHPPAIMAALAVVRQFITDPHLNVDRLAHASGLSRAHFTRAFTKHVGMSPMQHIVQRRLRRAAGYLQHSNLSIATIAADSGFPSRQRLHEVFVKWYGCSPSAWRRASPAERARYTPKNNASSNHTDETP